MTVKKKVSRKKVAKKAVAKKAVAKKAIAKKGAKKSGWATGAKDLLFFPNDLKFIKL